MNLAGIMNTGCIGNNYGTCGCQNNQQDNTALMLGSIFAMQNNNNTSSQEETDLVDQIDSEAIDIQTAAMNGADEKELNVMRGELTKKENKLRRLNS